MFRFLLGGGLRQIGQTAQQIGGVFKPNAEAHARRAHDYQSAALDQYASEFQHRANRTWFDSLVDGLNRLVRPVLALSTFSLFPLTGAWPEYMTIVFASWALLPVEAWTVFTIIITFYFAGRMQIKSQQYHESMQQAVANAPKVLENIQRLRDALTPQEAADDSNQTALDIAGDMTVADNPAIKDWKAGR